MTNALKVKYSSDFEESDNFVAEGGKHRAKLFEEMLGTLWLSTWMRLLHCTWFEKKEFENGLKISPLICTTLRTFRMFLHFMSNREILRCYELAWFFHGNGETVICELWVELCFCFSLTLLIDEKWEQGLWTPGQYLCLSHCDISRMLLNGSAV